MNRRNALRLFGALLVCLAGRGVARAGNETSDALEFRDFSGPMDYIFHEEGIGDIIIECKDGSKIITPFSDIVEALKGGPK